MLLDAGLVVNGRPMVFRAFQEERIDNLHLMRDLLDSGDYPLHAPYVRLHVLMDEDTESDTSAFHALILEAVDDGFDGIELNWYTPDLFNLVSFARTWGLGVGLWTVPERKGGRWPRFVRTLTRWSWTTTSATAGRSRKKRPSGSISTLSPRPMPLKCSGTALERTSTPPPWATPSFRPS